MFVRKNKDDLLVRICFTGDPILAGLPTYAHVGDAGLDLCSTEAFTLQPFERRLAHTGIAVEIPEGYAGFVLPRSGLAIKQGLSIVNAPGLIDSGYRGEVGVPLINLDAEKPIEIKAGDRIAQLVIMSVPRVKLFPCDKLSKTLRGDAGFGSTGVQ